MPIETEIYLADTAEAGLEMINNNHIQNIALIIMDFNLPLMSGYSAIISYKKATVNTPIIVITGSEDPQLIRQIHRYGVAAYISKATKPEIICSTIEKVLKGEYSDLSNEIELSDDGIANQTTMFTPMEIKVLVLLNRAYRNKDIATHLDIKEITVKKHISHIFDKLKVRTRTQVIKEIQKIGFFHDSSVLSAMLEMPEN
jgi:DNA-binding NarL/FixJ family response regulator